MLVKYLGSEVSLPVLKAWHPTCQLCDLKVFAHLLALLIHI